MELLEELEEKLEEGSSSSVSTCGGANSPNLKKLRSTLGWPEGYEGTNEYGFNIMAYGPRLFSDHEMRFYTSTEFLSSKATIYYAGYVTFYASKTTAESYTYGGDGKTYYLAIRCVMDDATFTKLEKAFK